MSNQCRDTLREMARCMMSHLDENQSVQMPDGSSVLVNPDEEFPREVLQTVCPFEYSNYMRCKVNQMSGHSRIRGNKTLR